MNNDKGLIDALVCSADTLYEGETWAYGGMSGSFEKTAKDWREADNLFKTNNYETCNVCGKKYKDNEFLYAGFFRNDARVKAGYKCNYQLKCLCKDCAYKISKKITEKDGTMVEFEKSS